MPQTIFERDFNPGFFTGWKGWRPENCPDLGADVPWAGTGAFWEQPITGAPVDTERTARLKSIDEPFGTAGGGKPDYLTGAHGTPYQTVDHVRGLTRVDPMNEPWWPFWTLQERLDAKAKYLPFPDPVRREGDPAGGGDHHWIGSDKKGRRLYEVISLVKQPNGTWQSTSITVWDTTRPWNEQPGGSIAIDTPVLPMLARHEEFAAGVIKHCVLYVATKYDRTFIAPARKSDGTEKGHPLRGGERLRLKAGTHLKHPEGSFERILCVCLETYGMIVSDKGGNAGLRMPQDPRLAKIDAKLRLTDFEVVQAVTDF